MYGNNGPPKNTTTKGNKKLAKLMDEYASSDENIEDSTPAPAPAEIMEPWQREFNQQV